MLIWQIVDVSVSTDAKLEANLDRASETAFTYSVTWKPSPVVYADRMDKYAKASFLPMVRPFDASTFGAFSA